MKSCLTRLSRRTKLWYKLLMLVSSLGIFHINKIGGWWQLAEPNVGVWDVLATMRAKGVCLKLSPISF